MQEFLETAFKEEFTENYKNDVSKIRQIISSYNDYLKIETFNLGLDEAMRKLNDDTYLSGIGIVYIDHGIKTLIYTKDYWNDIKFYISKDITKLEVPFGLIKDDLEFLNTFPNLTVLVINDYDNLSIEDINKLYLNTKIRKVFVDNLFLYNDYYKKNDFTISSYPYEILCYKNLVIEPIQRVAETEEDKFLFDRLIIKSYDLDKERIETVFNLNRDNLRNEIRIVTEQNDEYRLYFKNKNEIEKLFINSCNINDTKTFYNYLIENGYKIDNIEIDVQNIDYLNIDLSLFEEIAKDTNIFFKYTEIRHAEYESFKGLIQSIKWYRSLIDGVSSPVEKLTLAYDIMKTFNYNESNVSRADSRYPDRIIETGNIVCVGYSLFLKELLKGVNGLKVGNFDVKIFNEEDNTIIKHNRTMVQIDDDKYNIHGIYAIDATYDSIKENYKNILDDDYTALDLYQYFLIPASEYSKRFPHDTLPYIFKNNELSGENSEEFIKQYNIIFYGIFSDSNVNDGMTLKKIKEYIDVKRPSLEVFNKMLYIVRLAEGYNNLSALNEVVKVNRINLQLIEVLQDNDFPFFESEKQIK